MIYDNINGSLEKIIFNEDEMNKLKHAISELTQNRIDPSHISNLILNSQERILKELTEFNAFYITNELQKYRNSQDKNATDINKTKLLEALKEKNELLEIYGQRIQKILLKLKEKD